jgi:hypothetical protein
LRQSPRLAAEQGGPPIDGIYCKHCGMGLNEDPTLLPDQRPPCPRCGSLARRFEQEITDQIALSDRGTSTDALNVAKTDGSAAIAHAQTATVTVRAHDATVRTDSGDATDPSGPRHITDRLVVMGRWLDWIPLTNRSAGMGRSLWWVQLSEQPTWMVEVVDEAGELIGGGIELENNQIEALAGVAEYLLPSDAGPMLLTVTDQAGEVLAVSTTDNPVKTLAAVTDSLLPRHPG